MNKNIFVILAAACGIAMASCDTPSDLRPGQKVSVDYVEPGMRNTHNVESSKMGQHGHAQEQELMPNHDRGVNTIEPGDSVGETELTNTAEGAVRH